MDHFAVGKDVAAVGAGKAQSGVLFHDEDGDAFLSQVVDAFDDLLLVER